MFNSKARDVSKEPFSIRDCPSTQCSLEAFDEMRDTSARDSSFDPSQNIAKFPPTLDLYGFDGSGETAIERRSSTPPDLYAYDGSQCSDQQAEQRLATQDFIANEVPTGVNPETFETVIDGRPTTNSNRHAMEPVTDSSITKDISRRPDGRAVEPTYIGVDNTASYLGADKKKHIQSGIAAWLDKPVAEAFVMMNEKLAPFSKHVQMASADPDDDGSLNSAGRTHTQQRIATGIHAPPGNSVHEQGRGLDVRNFEDPSVRSALREFGFVQGNLSRPDLPINGDEWHFSFNPEAESSVERRWAERNHQLPPAEV